jgi:Bacterial Ig domain/Lactonase, 7-bladed beta-propeller
MVGERRIAQRVAAMAVIALIATLLTSSTAYAAQPLGALTQLSGKTGCFTFNGGSEDGSNTCSQARGMAAGESATVSPDGANVVVGSYPDPSFSLPPSYAVFTRNPTTGALTQLSGKAGCFTPDGSSSAGAGTCTVMRGLSSEAGDGHDVVFSADGKMAYIAADGDPASIMIFQRNTSTGALTQLPGTTGCITTDGSSSAGASTCQTDPHLLQAAGLTLSSDQRFLYVTGTGSSHQIEVYSRNTTSGALSLLQCISQAPAPSGCGVGRVVGDSEFIALSPNGQHAYAGQYDNGISVFDRNTTTGLLTQKSGTAGCITNSGNDDTGASTCAVGRESEGTFPLLIAPNGQTLYDTGFKGFATFHVNSDGSLTQLASANGCMTPDGKDNTGASTCAVGRAVDAPYGGVIAPDGKTLYISDYGQTQIGGVAILSLNSTTGVATQLAGLAGCITVDGSSGLGGTPGVCQNGRALASPYGMAISPDGSSVYQATDAPSNAGLAIYRGETAPVCAVSDTVHIRFRDPPVLMLLECADPDGEATTTSIVTSPRHGKLTAVDPSKGRFTYTPAKNFSGKDSFTYRASDGLNLSSPPTQVSITIGPRPKVSGLHVASSKGKQKVSYKLNVVDKVAFTIKRNGHALKGKIVQTGRVGANHLSFTKFGGHSLGAGNYQLLAVPAQGGKQSKVSFKIGP